MEEEKVMIQDYLNSETVKQVDTHEGKASVKEFKEATKQTFNHPGTGSTICFTSLQNIF